jgi:thiopeptide-type bacteriocin biosynthesis protein
MSDQPTCQTADFFVLRTPGLPLDALSVRDQTGRGVVAAEGSSGDLERDREGLRQLLRELIQQQLPREAVALASPDLASRLEAWLDGALKQPEARNVERALLKYLGRMSGRATPFGLFAGVSMGVWGAASRLSVVSWLACRKVLRLDWGVLETLVDGLEREPEVRAALTYRPNSSLYLRGGWHRFLERRERAYHLEAVEATPHLEFVLQQASEGARLEDIATSLARQMNVDLPTVENFLGQLIDAQVLCGNLQPPLTSANPLGQVVSTLQADPLTAGRAAPLIALEQELEALQGAQLGSRLEGYRSLAVPLAALGIASETRDVLQVDLFRPAPELALSKPVRRALEEGVETLRRLTPPPTAGPLDRFRTAFQARYGTRWVPLLDVLDEESGLGFDGGDPMDSPLLDGLPFRSAPPPRQLSRRDEYLLAQLPRWQGSHAWALDEADMAVLARPEPPPFAPSFAALASLEASNPAALDRGEFRFWMEHYSGPTAARWLGRFASGDAGLRDALQSHLRKEESLRPDVVFAEVVHVPEGRMGNVLARPALRDYELPFLATPGTAPDRTILPADLQLTVRGNRVVLASTRLGREVVPRLSSAHNFARGPVVYRFLAHLQDQDGRPGGWSWGALAEQPFLPRVTRGRHILCKARWRFEARELKEALQNSPDGAWGAFQALRKRRGLPRFLLLTEADNQLQVDLDQVLWVETLHQLVASRATFTLTECFPDPGQGLVTSPEGRFAHELIIPFEATAPSQPKAKPPQAPVVLPEARAFPPGSAWLYLKLYCGPASADRLLVELEPLLRVTQAEGLWDRWHFVRYHDPDHHLRLRFHGLPSRLLAELLPRLHEHLEAGLAQGLLWKWQVDTFEPEWERYGGPLGFGLAERWFFEDSQWILAQLAGRLTLEQRWRVGLRHTDAIWAALGLGLQARKGLARTLRDGFRKEFADTGEGAIQMGARFRALRTELESGFPQAPGALFAPELESLCRLRVAFDQGLLQEELASLAGSLSHMHLNRLLRSNQREHEWVLMEFLTRLYESSLARHPGP